MMVIRLLTFLLLALLFKSGFAAPPKLSIIHFDVNVGDATLFISPEGKGLLIDAGDRGRGFNPVVEYMNRAKADGRLISLDYIVASHYDSDHIGGIDEVINSGWSPRLGVLDRGNGNVRPIDNTKKCNFDWDKVRKIGLIDAPSQYCSVRQRKMTCSIGEYLLAAEKTGKRRAVQPGDTFQLGSVDFQVLAVNANSADGESVDVYFDGRRADCGENDFSIAMLLRFGDFDYLTTGDLTGNSSEKVADVERLLIPQLDEIDVYRVGHHGSTTSSSNQFIKTILPSVAIVSNGRKHSHPSSAVMENLSNLDSKPDIYATNYNPDGWRADNGQGFFADQNYDDYDGIIEISVWKRSYRVYMWNDGKRDGSGKRYLIKK